MSTPPTAPPTAPTTPFTAPATPTLVVSARKRSARPASIVDRMMRQYQRDKSKGKAMDRAAAAAYAQKFVAYAKYRYDQAIAAGKTRKLPHFSYAQTSLSNFKRRVRDELGETSADFLKSLRLTREQGNVLEAAKKRVVHQKAIDLPEVDGDAVVLDCRKMLSSDDPYLRLIALACLTGRRTAELLYSIRFRPPQEAHKTSSKYWAHVTGFLKQRKGDPDAVVSREVPLLADRKSIVEALKATRAVLKADSVRDVNLRHAKKIHRHMHKYCPTIGNIHQFRKLYALMCFHYFNSRQCSLPRVASDYLGHKMVSDSILTYLNFHLKPLGRLDFSAP